jgi:hypothetical protein
MFLTQTLHGVQEDESFVEHKHNFATSQTLAALCQPRSWEPRVPFSSPVAWQGRGI